MEPIDPPRSKRWKKVKRLFLAAIVSLLLAVGSLPWLASTGAGRGMLLSYANDALAPSRIEARSVRFSWFGSQQATGLVLRNKAGKAIVSVPRATVRRSLVGLALESPIRADVLLEGGAIDLERHPDGSYDLLEALAPVMGGDSGAGPQAPGAPADAAQPTSTAGPSLSLRLVKGSIVIRSDLLERPITARRLDMAVRVPPASGPVTWQMALAEPTGGDESTLQVSGQLERREQTSGAIDLAAKIVARGWPLGVTIGGVTAGGQLDGNLDVTRGATRWDYSGKGSVIGLDASGPALAGDRLRLDRIDALYALASTDQGWNVRRLDVTAPVGSIKASGSTGITPTSSAMRVEGQLDLAALARQLPHLLRIREGLSVEKGLANVVAEIGEAGAQGGSTLAVDARISDLLARDRTRTIAIRDPATLSARLVRRTDDLKVERLAVKTAFLDASGTGDLAGGIKVTATIDLAGLERQLHELVDFGGVELAGRGRLAADYRRSEGGRYTARLAAEFQKLRIAGLTEQPFAREAMRLDAAAVGPLAAEESLPRSWSQVRLGVKADDLDAETSLSTATTDGAFQIDQLRLAMQLPAVPPVPPAPAQPADTIRFASKGRFDPNTGTLELRPLPGPASRPEPIALIDEGVRIVGLNRGGDMQVNAALAGDLARIDRALAWWWSSAPMDLAGALTVKTGIKTKAKGELTAAIAVNSPDMSLAPSEGTTARQPFGPVLIGMQARRAADVDRLDLVSLAMACRYGNVHAKGSVQEPGGRRLADLAGTLAPNWTTIDPVVGQWVEPRAKVRAVPRPFRLRGPVPAGGAIAILQGMEAELGFDRFEAVAFGARVAPTPIVVHWKGRQGLVEPIETTINNGKTSLRPDFVIDEGGTLSFRLAAGSSIKGAEINDEVSRSLLAYIAPVLHDATQARGKVTVEVSRAEFPLMGDQTRRSTLIGRVEFDDVAFSAGPLAGELVALSGSKRDAVLRLDQPVELAIADGRVNQRGLSVPVGRDARLELEGSVGFDRTIAMRARVPIRPGMLGNRDDVNQLVEGLRVGVPIGGTLAHPKIDRGALGAGFRDASKTVIERGATDILKRLATPERGDRPPLRRGR